MSVYLKFSLIIFSKADYFVKKVRIILLSCAFSFFAVIFFSGIVENASTLHELS